MSLETQSLEFGEFLLDLKEKVLLRNGERLPINPKTFQLLVTLIEDHGHLVEKDRLMKTLWPDSFVEEANLAFTVSLLRKTLGDNTQNPRYIETVPRRGYRFIAEVRESVDKNGSADGSSNSINRKTAKPPRFKRPFLPAAALLIIGVIVGGLWYAKSRNSGDEAPILLAEFSSEQLSVDGKVQNAAISPDGKNVVYTYTTDNKQSVWLRDLETSTNVQIIPPSENLYFELVISPDGRSLFFARVSRPQPAGVQPDIYRISIFGGVPTKIISQAEGSVGVSPDGRLISFRRCLHTADEYCSLWIADSDGKNERRLLSRPGPIRIGDQKISPDGKTIAFAVGQSRNWANEFSVAEVDIETGTEREFTQEKFFDIRRMAWLPDGRGLLLASKKYPDNNFRIWKVSTETGQATVLTNDAESYVALSLNHDATALVCTKHKPDFNLNIYGGENGPIRPQILAEASTVSFASDGAVLFSSAMTGNHEISTVNVDGTGQRQLTNDLAVDLNGTISPDKNFIYFDSNRGGEAQVWRMNADGTGQQQLTFKYGGSPLLVSPDGKWLYYLSARDRKLMRISTDGGEEELVWEKSYNHHFALSPDASRVAFSESRDTRTVISIVSLADKQTINTFVVPNEKTGVVQSAWSADGTSLFYIAPDDRLQNYVIWKQPLDGATPIRIIDLGPEGLRETKAFAVSPDGRSFAVIQGSWKHDAVLLKGLQ
jgi:Tol biopolymer transport system component/DNA-binding winged helix-turn-helix (wHTH) protein